jgi:hypothetical protein
MNVYVQVVGDDLVVHSMELKYVELRYLEH